MIFFPPLSNKPNQGERLLVVFNFTGASSCQTPPPMFNTLPCPLSMSILSAPEMYCTNGTSGGGPREDGADADVKMRHQGRRLGIVHLDIVDSALGVRVPGPHRRAGTFLESVLPKMELDADRLFNADVFTSADVILTSRRRRRRGRRWWCRAGGSSLN